MLKSVSIAALAAAMAIAAPVARAQDNAVQQLFDRYPDLRALDAPGCPAIIAKIETDRGEGMLERILRRDLDNDPPPGLSAREVNCFKAAGRVMAAGGGGDGGGAPAAEADKPMTFGELGETPAAEAPPAETAEAGTAAESAAPADTAQTAGTEAPAEGGTATYADPSGGTDTAAAPAAETAAEPATETAEQTTRDPALEAVQTDTAAAERAANRQVRAEAARAARQEARERAKVRREVVTEETSRSSNEEFARPAAQTEAGSDDNGLKIGQIAAGVLGGYVLSQVLNQNEQVVENTGDRVVVQRGDGDFYVLKDENALLRRPGTEIETETFDDGSTRSVATREDGSQVITIRAANGQVLRRVRLSPSGDEVVLFDDTLEIRPVDVSELPDPSTERLSISATDEGDALRRALERSEGIDRRFSLAQIREIRAVRALVPILELESVTFDTNSAVVRATEAENLAAIGRAMRELVRDNPYEVFLIEGHTDAVGSASYNLALSDRRAESVALALTEYFDVPPENMVVQGYGESNLRIPTPEAERANRRAAVRRITPLLNGAQL